MIGVIRRTGRVKLKPAKCKFTQHASLAFGLLKNETYLYSTT